MHPAESSTAAAVANTAARISAGIQRKAISRNAFWNSVGYTCDKAVGLLLLAFVARHISVTDFGILVLAQSVVAMLGLLDLGLASILVQEFIAAANNKEAAMRSLLATALALFAALGVVAVLLCAAIAISSPLLFHIPAPSIAIARTVIAILGLGLFASFVSRVLELFCESTGSYDTLNRYQLVTSVLRVGMTVGALSAGFGVVGLAWVYTAAVVWKLGLLWFRVGRMVPGGAVHGQEVEASGMRLLLRNSRWALADNMVRQAGTNNDALLLALLAPLAQVGLYGMGARIPREFVTLLTKPLATLLPCFSEQALTGQTERLRDNFVTSCRVVMFASLPMLVLCLAAAPVMLRLWVGAAYLAAAPVLQWMAVAALAAVMFMPADQVLYSSARIKTAARIAGVETLANVALSLALIRPYGAAGVAAATAVTHLAGTALAYIPAACRLLGIRTTALFKLLLSDNWLPVAVAALPLAAMRMAPATPLRDIIFAAAALLLYVGVWLLRTGRPLWAHVLIGRGEPSLPEVQVQASVP